MNQPGEHMTPNTKPIKGFTISEMMERGKAEERRVKVETQGIVLDGHYQIQFDRITTHAAILEWVLHLCGKEWVSPTMLRNVAEIAASHHKLKLYAGV